MVGIDMAIVIPSSKTYDRQNPKVRDNVIERIEIGAVEVLPNNEYETTVYNKDLDISNFETAENTIAQYEDAIATNQGGSTIRNVRAACGLKYELKYIEIPQILIPKVKENKFISKIYDGKDDKGNPRIKLGLRIKQTNYKGNSSYQPSSNTFDFDGGDLIKEENQKENIFYSFEDFEYKNDISSTVSSLVISNVSSLSANHSIIEKDNKLEISSYLYANSNFNWSPSSVNVDSSINANLRENNIVVTSEIIGGVEYYKLSSTKILISVNATFMSCLIENSNNFSSISAYYRAVATRVLQECQEISLTVYGNTIGIDLKDKTVYINGKTQKKVHSIEGNELMQTSNYLLDSEENAIKTMYGETRKKYERGKETATIRCSIGNYYDYDTYEKVIAIDNSTSKMSFKLYDQVIPMVYGSDGKDKPMSTYQDGSPKVFQVLGSKIFYDGAVWQELSLQEV